MSDIIKHDNPYSVTLRATNRGNFNEQFGIDVDCYVLDDESKTAVISQRGMGAAIGIDKTSGIALKRFARGKIISEMLGAGLLEKIDNPLIFNDYTPGGSSSKSTIIHGYDVTILIDICKAIVKADDDGKLMPHQRHIAKQARMLISASAKAGIRSLVYAIAGYDETKEERIRAFQFYVREEARDYEKEFGRELYDEWYRLYSLKKNEVFKNHPWLFARLTREQVYIPLAESNGAILSMLQKNKKLNGMLNKKNDKLKQKNKKQKQKYGELKRKNDQQN